MRTLLLLLTLFVTLPASAREYQCIMDNRIVWQDTPCKGDPHGGMNTVGEEMERRRKTKEAATAQTAAKQRACEENFVGKASLAVAYDGAIPGVERYIKRSLKDPDSMQIIEWGRPAKDCAGYTTTVKFRAKNSYGGYVVETHIVTLDPSGAVTMSMKYR